MPSPHRILSRLGRFALAVGILSIPLLTAETPAVRAANEAKTKSGTSVTEVASFAKKAAIGDMFEIESSKLAASKSVNAEVQKFAQAMIDAHAKTTARMQSLAAHEGIAAELPKEMDRKHAGMLSELKGLSGARFDRKYVETQVAAHTEAASLFDSYAVSGKNPAFKQFANDMAPAIKAHLDHARMMMESTSSS